MRKYVERCLCGTILPSVKPNETPYQYCSEECKSAGELWDLLLPGLKVKRNGRVDTKFGDKTPIGLYRMIGSRIFS